MLVSGSGGTVACVKATNQCMVYLRARYYQPGSGRFGTEDPVKDNNNWYAYCYNNPGNAIDPSGLDYVMLSYIIEKNKGTVQTNSDGTIIAKVPGFKEVSFKDNGNGSVNIVVDGQESVTAGRVINNQLVVDSQLLMGSFGLTESQATHQSEDSFKSLDDAVVAYGLTYYSASKSSDAWPNGCEYSAYLYNNGDGTFSFGNVLEPTSVNTSPFPEIDTSKTLVGWIHTHPNPGDGYLVEQFSGSSVDNDGNWSGDGAVTMSLGVPGYLVTPSGTIFGLNANWRGGRQ